MGHVRVQAATCPMVSRGVPGCIIPDGELVGAVGGSLRQSTVEVTAKVGLRSGVMWGVSIHDQVRVRATSMVRVRVGCDV